MEEEFMRLEIDQKWEEHYKMLSEMSKNNNLEIAHSEQTLNRYGDVRPYDNTRVKLVKAKDTDYINANLVTVPKAARRYILTQGPLPETIDHFWLMVWEQQSNVIVMLNRLVEDSIIKNHQCLSYWPKQIGETRVFDSVKLSVQCKTIKTMKHYTVREMILEDIESKKTRPVQQFHYTSWPDNDQPDSPMSFLRLLTAIRKSGGLDKMDQPTIVHCLAGIGRSGTFCLIDSILNMIESQGSTEGIDIVNTLLEMRNHRMGLIQSHLQLRFAFMTIIYGIKILEKANKLHPHISSIKDGNNANHDNNSLSQQKINGSNNQPMNGNKKPRRAKKKQNSQNSGLLNMFKKHLLVEALDDIDSDSADSLYYDEMKPWPSIKKPRNSSPEDDNYPGSSDFINDVTNANATTSSETITNPTATIQQETKAQKLTNVMSLFTENSISTNTSNTSLSTDSVPQNDSVLIRRREKELRNQRNIEKSIEIKNRMKAEELKRETKSRRMSFLKKSAVVGGIVTLILSSAVYLYNMRNVSL